MAADLLEASPVFRAAIEACAKALKPKGVNLMAEFARADGWSAPALAMAGLSATQARSLPAPLLDRMMLGGAVPAGSLAEHLEWHGSVGTQKTGRRLLERARACHGRPVRHPGAPRW